MQKFVYKARNAQKQLLEGFKFGNSSRDIVNSLRDEGLIAISVEEAVDRLSGMAKPKKISAPLFGGSSVGYKDVSVFCRQLATLINAGVNILDCIDDISEMVPNPNFRKILKTVATDVRGGATFSDALKRHPKAFDKIFVSMIASGERSGKLGRVLMDLALYLENIVKLRRKVNSASVYPVVIGFFFICVLLFLVFYLIPKFAALFSSFGAELPLPTRIVMNLSSTMIKSWPLELISALALIFGIPMINRTPPGKYLFDNLKLNIPIFGPIYTKVIFARFFQTLSTLLRSGVDIIGSLDIASQVTNNVPIEQKIENIKSRIVEGSTLAGEMNKNPIFPKMTVRMVAVGEKSGKLDDMLSKISDYFSDEVDAAVAAMSSLIEPFLIVMLGGMVGLVVVAMYLPIFKLAGAMMGSH